MKILYGVQGTGNGHISRARAIAEALKQYPEIEITWLFSGRDRDKFFDMEVFEDYEWRRGLTFITEKGKINNLKTTAGIKPKRLIDDIQSLNLDRYDVIATDYEPVTAWAGQLARREVIGIGHQYAFNFDIPTTGDTALTNLIMRYFAPADISLGLHWADFGFPILPPIAEIHGTYKPDNPNKVLVYLPFEHNPQVIKMLRPLREYDFYVYSPGLKDKDLGNIHTRKASRDGFQSDLMDAKFVISNSGFELISESLMLGKRILTKPVKGQMEQLSNALALHKLNYATVTHKLDTGVVAKWLGSGRKTKKVQYPDVASAICEWLIDPNRPPASELSKSLWEQTKVGD